MYWLFGALNVYENSPNLVDASDLHENYIFKGFRKVGTEMVQQRSLATFKTSSAIRLLYHTAIKLVS